MAHVERIIIGARQFHISHPDAWKTPADKMNTLKGGFKVDTNGPDGFKVLGENIESLSDAHRLVLQNAPYSISAISDLPHTSYPNAVLG